jgi:hypothetical protein
MSRTLTFPHAFDEASLPAHAFDGTERRLTVFRPPCPFRLIERAMPRVLALIVSEYVGDNDMMVPIEEFAERVCIKKIVANVAIYGSELLGKLELSEIGASIKICAPATLKSLILRTVWVNINWVEGVLPNSLIHVHGSNARRFPCPMENMPNLESIAVSNIGIWGYINIIGIAAGLRELGCDSVSSVVKIDFDGMPLIDTLYLSEVRCPLTLAHRSRLCKLGSLRVYNSTGEWDFSGIPETIKIISLVNAVDPVDFAKIKCPENAVFMEVRGSPPRFSWS